MNPLMNDGSEEIKAKVKEIMCINEQVDRLDVIIKAMHANLAQNDTPIEIQVMVNNMAYLVPITGLSAVLYNILVEHKYSLIARAKELMK